MLVLQQVKVLPKGAEIIIYDGFDIVSHFEKSEVDDSLKFNNVKDAERYDKVFSTFKVYGLKGYIFNPSITFSNVDCKILYIIQIREEF